MLRPLGVNGREGAQGNSWWWQTLEQLISPLCASLDLKTHCTMGLVHWIPSLILLWEPLRFGFAFPVLCAHVREMAVTFALI